MDWFGSRRRVVPPPAAGALNDYGTRGAQCDGARRVRAEGHLRVAAILDLARAGTLAVRMVPTVREFAHDALEVVRTRDI
jgi:hypothetical protein